MTLSEIIDELEYIQLYYNAQSVMIGELIEELQTAEKPPPEMAMYYLRGALRELSPGIEE